MSKTSKKLLAVIIVALAVCAGAVVWFFLLRSRPPAPPAAVPPPSVPAQTKKPAVTAHKPARQTAKPAAQKGPRPVLVDDETADLPAADKEAIQKIQDALDADDLPGVLAACRTAADSKSAAVRQRAVEALGWFGEQALPELTPFLADSDDDIASAAEQQWSSALSEVEDTNKRALVVEAAMSVLTDKDALDNIASKLDALPNAQALQTLVNVINGKNAAAAATAKESYKFMTGDDYTDLATAQKWLDENPDDDSDADDGAPGDAAGAASPEE